MEEILSDKDTYEIINKDPTKKVTSELRSLLVRWKSNKFIDDSTYRRLLMTDGIIPRAYGLTKIHKQGNPLRIIVSSTNSPLYYFSLYLHNIINDSILEAPSYIRNSFQLVEKLKDICIEPDYLLVSLDVVSLFTNVPIELVSDGIAKRWEYISGKTVIPLNEFLIAVRLVLNSTFFMFNNKYYKQIFGTPMGSPLSPIAADIVMQDFEGKDQLDPLFNQNVVYKISCDDCEASYVGQTKRQLKTRLHEHVSDINKKSKSPTVITCHRIDQNHNFDWDNVEILDREASFNKRLISEMVHIKRQTHGLNKQNDTESLPESYLNIIQSLSPS
ncbi:uncharacterized protein [Mycetomoellerius zeteki]|uniref:uncharacterized protein n=1 Tax=Mycetomoellerius zeteki TaxID=64791 RepID=UPI00084E73C2|nr:PREDICTED: uncharacterized protein LOC108725945 [Trachymyrmex zeteki]